MPSCALRYCKSRYNNTSIRDYGLFSFPPVSDIGREKWIQFVQRERSEPYWLPSGSSKLCSKHFKSEDIYYGKTGRRVIKKGSVPLYITKAHSPARNEDPENSAEVVTVEDSNADDARSGSHISEDLVSDTDSIFDTPLVTTLKTQLKLSLQKNNKYRSQIHRLQKKSKYFKSKTTTLRIVVKQLRNKIEVFKKIISKLSENAKKARRD